MVGAGIDVIGDVHGQVTMLTDLLASLGYTSERGVWGHPGRKVVFIGDLIDRNPGQLGVVRIARAMVEAGTALVLMGNHEFNAIAWATPHPGRPGEHLRPHSEKNFKQHEAFLAEVGEGSDCHNEIIAWFMTLPLWLELDGARFVHACWDPAAMEAIGPMLGPGNTLTESLLVEAAVKPAPGTPNEERRAYDAIEHLLKGPEVELPEDCEYLDKGNHLRRHARFAWWHRLAHRLPHAVVIPRGTVRPDGSPFPELPDTEIATPVDPYMDEVPLFVGHYWNSGSPRIMGRHVACVDYSAGTTGPLVAYRWSGETALDDGHFVAMPPRSRR
jgi:hypothetical protein